jgi:hypothetical protein
MGRKTRIGYQAVELILEEISFIDKINRQWKDGLITEFQFSESLDRLLINIKRHQTESKQPDSGSLSEKAWRKKND